MSGGREALALKFILTIWGRSGRIGSGLHQMALLTNQRCGSANVMEVFAGFWFVSIRCTTKRDGSRVGILRVPTLTTASELRRNSSWRTPLSVKKSTKPRCLKRLSGPPPLCKPCSRASPKLHQAIPRFSSRVKREQEKSLLHVPFIGDPRGLDVLSSA